MNKLNMKFDGDYYYIEQPWFVNTGIVAQHRCIGIFTNRTIPDICANATRHWRINLGRLRDIGVEHILFFRNSDGCPDLDVPHGHVFGFGHIAAYRLYDPRENQTSDQKGFIMDRFARLSKAAWWGHRSPILYGDMIPVPPGLDLTGIVLEPVANFIPATETTPNTGSLLEAVRATYRVLVDHYGENGPPQTNPFREAFDKVRACIR